MSRLPVPGSDDNTWGEILNDFLEVSHNSDGTVKAGAVADDTTIQRISVRKNGAAIGQRPEVNFVAGANTTLSVSDDSVNNRVNVTVTANLDAAIDSTAASLGLTAQTLQIEQTASAFVLSTGTCVFVRIYIPTSTISTLGTWRTNEGFTPTGYSGMALYTPSGVLIDKTNDMSADLTAFGNAWISGTLSGGPRSVTAGSYYLAFLSSLTDGPKIAGVQAYTNVPHVNGARPTIYLTGQSNFPASFDPESANTNSGIYYMTVS